MLALDTCTNTARPFGSRSVFIRRLNAPDGRAISAHFVRLSASDRHLRFCQERTDTQLEQYVAELQYDRDPVLGAFSEGRLVGVCHVGLALGEPVPTAELGISVDHAARGLRVGAALMNAAFVSAAHHGCTMVLIYYLQQNHRMHGMCVRLGADVARVAGECTGLIPLVAVWDGAVLSSLTAGSRCIPLPESLLQEAPPAQ